jgi:ethanolamine ammonia-lyase small subunit
MSGPVVDDPWHGLRRFTAARIALGRAGDSLPTQALLDFGAAHAAARDAVHRSLDVARIKDQLGANAEPIVQVHSAAVDRPTYLRRPDLGRRLDGQSEAALAALRPATPCDLLFVIADGLSAFAPERHAAALLEVVIPRLQGFSIAPIVIAEQARVALGDEIGAAWGAHFVAVLIGERPGLSSPDSLGIYLTYQPRRGRSDAERNCISNIRPEGLSYRSAAHKLEFLLQGARRLGATGVLLKDESDADARAMLP